MKSIRAFPYYGGKGGPMLKEILRHIPVRGVNCIVEPFCGSGVISLTLPPRRGVLQVMNDQNDWIMNFFEVIKREPDELLRRIHLTPFSERFHIQHEKLMLTTKCADSGLEPMDAAVAVWHHYNCSAMALKYFFPDVGRQHNSRERTELVARRMARIVLCCRDALSVIRRYDSPSTLIIADPPYVHSTRSGSRAYGRAEQGDEFHRAFIDLMKEVKSRAIVCGYECDLYNELLGHGYELHTHKKKAPLPPGRRQATSERVECLWVKGGATLL